MGMLEVERVQDTLWVTGNVVPSEEKALEQALQEFVQEVRSPARAVDMSGVRYLSPSGAKSVLQVAQGARGGKLKVRSSIPVARTLSLLGAETWLEMETCQKQNVKPSVADVTPPSVPPPGPAEEPIRAADASEVRRTSVGLNAPGTSSVRQSAVATVSSEPAVAEATARAGQSLVPAGEEVPADLIPLKRLIVMQTYTFHVVGARNEVTARVLTHLGGPWILVDAHGARKYINLREVGIIDLLA